MLGQHERETVVVLLGEGKSVVVGWHGFPPGGGGGVQGAKPGGLVGQNGGGGWLTA